MLQQTETTDPTVPPDPTGPPGRGHRFNTLTILGIAVAVLVVATMAVALVEWNRDNGQAGRLRSLESLRASATKAADTYGVEFGSYSYADLHGPTAPWTQIEDHSTASFRSDYQRTSGLLEPTIAAYKASAKATVSESAASSVTPSKAVVLLLLNQTITNSTQKSGPQSQQFIVTMTLLRQKGQWVIDNVGAST